MHDNTFVSLNLKDIRKLVKEYQCSIMTGFLPGILYRGQICCYTNFFCYANFSIFSDQILRGANISEGPRPPPPVEESQYDNNVHFEEVRFICNLHRLGGGTYQPPMLSVLYLQVRVLASGC